MATLVPARCPRCERPFEQEAVPRTPDGLADAGCACGEVTRVFLDHELDRAPTNTTEPPGWVERPRIGGVVASFARPRLPARGRAILLAPPAIIFALAYAVSFVAWGLAAVGFALGLLVCLALLGWVVRRTRWQQRSTFAFGDGRFRVVHGTAHDVPLDDITRFTVATYPRTPHVPERYALQAVRRSALPVTVPLPVLAGEAAFVADRLNALLNAGGRVDTGYRGELRVAEDERLDAFVDEEPPRRARRLFR